MENRVLVYRTKYQPKSIDYSSMVGKVYRVFKETPSNYIVYSNKEYSSVTVVSKRDCRKTNESTINYEW